jgi:hypothetical protein
LRELGPVGRLAAGLALSAASSVAPAGADRPPLLDVPYFAQSPELCGGASAAMVMRYWGEDAAPESFQDLLRQDGFGIGTDRLTAEWQCGWEAPSRRRAKSAGIFLADHRLDEAHPRCSL